MNNVNAEKCCIHQPLTKHFPVRFPTFRAPFKLASEPFRLAPMVYSHSEDMHLLSRFKIICVYIYFNEAKP